MYGPASFQSHMCANFEEIEKDSFRARKIEDDKPILLVMRSCKEYTYVLLNASHSISLRSMGLTCKKSNKVLTFQEALNLNKR